MHSTPRHRPSPRSNFFSSGVRVFFGLSLIAACEPDLDSLVAGNGLGDAGGSSGSDGSGGSTSGSGGSGGGVLPDECSDHEKAENESDVDCGGTSDCGGCDVGKMCGIHEDCRASFCLEGYCVTPTCNDEWRNQDETDIDCGGICAAVKRCELGRGCNVGSDCASDYCDAGECKNHCLSGVRESDETDDDCGGSTCEPCANGGACLVPSDCVSETCSTEMCVPQTCEDDSKNQDETDIDCGGSCSPCALDEDCKLPSDCESYVCTATTCAPDLVIPTDDVIDDMEDGNNTILANGGRLGSWHRFGDEEGTDNLVIANIPGKRGAASARSIRNDGSGFTIWGSGIGLDLYNPGGSAASKQPYDASAYTGVTFWGRADVLTTVKVAFPDRNTDPAGGLCADAGTCDAHWEKTVQLDSQWERLTVRFSELTLPSATVDPPPPDPTGLISIQFRHATSAVYDIWIDDLAFIKD